jgi:hypothetical protein
MLRASFKSYTCLKKTVDNQLINDLMGYSLNERSNILHFISEQKWAQRQKGQTYNPLKNRGISLSPIESVGNRCKNQPKSMVKYINMQISLYPKCKEQDINARCTKGHLEKWHNVLIDSVYTIMEDGQNFSKSKEIDERGKIVRRKRAEIMEHMERVIQLNITKLKRFFCIETH